MTDVAQPVAKSPASAAPVAEKRAKTFDEHGIERNDEYYWLRHRDDPEVIAYLEAENRYVADILADTAELQKTLYEEIRGRLREDEQSAPYLDNGYWYYKRFEEGAEYPIYARRKGTLDADEEVILDVRAIAKGHEFTAVRGLDVSPDTNWLTYAVDTVGRRLYELRVRNLVTGEDYDTGVRGISPGARWANDNETLFFTLKDPETLRSYRIMRGRFTPGEPLATTLVYDETDETYSASLGRSRTGDLLLIYSGSTVATEYRLIDANDPGKTPEVLLERRRDHEYFIDYDGSEFFMLSNDGAKNFRLLATKKPSPDLDDWREVVAHDPDTLLEDFEIFRDHIVVQEKHAGLTRLVVIDRSDGSAHRVDFGEATYSAELVDNESFDLDTVRFAYESMTSPDSIYDYSFEDRERTLVKQDEVLGGYDASEYQSERLEATASDGTLVPVSVVYRKDTPRDGTAPVLQYGYGSYGYSVDPGFSYSRISLLDRGFVYAIAHIRGGSDLGRAWYDDGKLLNKKNTFTDFIAVGEHLIAEGYAAPDGLYAMGGSAGGLLVGAVMNMRPDLYRGIVAAVPFVDVITTMFDETIPLTTSEYDEWGDPSKREYFDYMLSYSPYDNVREIEYPDILITAGLHDSQVQYWEPAKWAARLRDRRKGDSRVLLHTNMDAGHGGASGRFEALRETALEYAFLLKLEAERQEAR